MCIQLLGEQLCVTQISSLTSIFPSGHVLNRTPLKHMCASHAQRYFYFEEVITTHLHYVNMYYVVCTGLTDVIKCTLAQILAMTVCTGGQSNSCHILTTQPHQVLSHTHA